MPKPNKLSIPNAPPPDQELRLMDAWWRAANYLSVGQIYLLDNPLLEKPLELKHIKPRLLGHCGTTPGLNFLHVHLNRVIKAHDLNVIYIAGPGHGGPGIVANTWLEGSAKARPIWPMIIMKTPKGWTGPREVDGLKAEGFWRSHQVPFGEMSTRPDHVRLLEDWMKSYRPDELFDPNGAPRPEIAALAPEGGRRMSANPHANGGLLRYELDLPAIGDYAVKVDKSGERDAEATAVMAEYLRDVVRSSETRRNFRIFGPDETASNRLSHVFEATNRTWVAETLPYDEHLAPDGRVMEILSEHTCQGWLEGYLLTGRHGIFSCYEAFIHIIDSMFNQHAKWLKVCREIPWRRPIPSLNYLLTSHVWRQDHNGFSHQDPGFIDYVCNKKSDIVRVYLPPDANSLLFVTDHCLRSWNRIKCDRGWQAAGPAMAQHGRGHQALYCRYRYLGVGEQRPWRGTRRGHGLCRRRADLGNTGRRRSPQASYSRA
jgi:phosphoketolase